MSDDELRALRAEMAALGHPADDFSDEQVEHALARFGALEDLYRYDEWDSGEAMAMIAAEASHADFAARLWGVLPEILEQREVAAAAAAMEGRRRREGAVTVTAGERLEAGDFVCLGPDGLAYRYPYLSPPPPESPRDV